MADSPTDAEAVAALLSMGEGSMAGGHPSPQGTGARRLVRRRAAGVISNVTERARPNEQRSPAPLLHGHLGVPAVAGSPLAAALPARSAQRHLNQQGGGSGDWGQLQWPAQRGLRSRVPDRESAEAPARLSGKRRKVILNTLAPA